MSDKAIGIPLSAYETKNLACLVKLNEYVQQHFDTLIGRFLTQFEQYCRKITLMQEAGKKGAIGFIHLSILRTNIVAKVHKIRMDAYDINWYADRTECSGEYNVHEYCVWLDEFADTLKSLINISYGHTKQSEFQRIIFAESNRYFLPVAELVRVGLKKASETEWFQSVKRNELFVVCIGAFQDKSDILYKEDSTVKNSKEVKRHLESKHLPAYTYEICDGLDLSSGNYRDIRLLFSTFSNCDFNDSIFSNALIMFSSFQQSVIQNVKMDKVQIIDTVFSGAVIENVSFKGAMLRHLSFAGAKLINVSFDGVLTADELDFDQAILIDTVIPNKSRG